ncbi:MAG: type II toxin-antitoxin system VapC family toxin [Actinomycetota bacterium]
MIVLDAWAILALLRGEPSGVRVQQAVATGRVLASWVNLGEVFYKQVRKVGEARAKEMLPQVLANIRGEEPDRNLVLAAATLKVAGGLSYADCFALATAGRHRAPLLTGDPEIIAHAGDVEVVDLRSAA